MEQLEQQYLVRDFVDNYRSYKVSEKLFKDWCGKAEHRIRSLFALFGKALYCLNDFFLTMVDIYIYVYNRE